MSALAEPRRIRMVNKIWIKDLIKLAKNQMVNQAVANQGLADNARLWIANMKGLVTPMTINPRRQLLGELKNVIFQIALKDLNINFFCFAFPKFVPRKKDIL